MAMKPILGPDGEPLHRTSRQLIRPGLSHALGTWQASVDEGIQAEHDSGGGHQGLRHPKAAIWVKDVERTGSIDSGSVIGTAQARHGENIEYHSRGISGGLWEGELIFLEGFPGVMAVLNSWWWPRTNGGPERYWEISGDSLWVRIHTTPAFGVVIY